MKSIVFALFLASALAWPQDATRGIRSAAPGTPTFDILRAGKTRALLIGTNKYDDPSWPTLVNPLVDVHDIADELKRNYGYQTEILENPTHLDVKLKLTEYIERVTFGANDNLLVYIAGHGIYVNQDDEGFLAFRDSRDIAKDVSKDTYVDYTYLTKQVNKIGAKHILLIVDACHSGTLSDALISRGTNDFKYEEATKAEILARKADLSTRIYMTSGGNESVPDGRPGQNSPFAAEILGALRTYGGGTGLLSFNDLWSRAERAKTSPRFGQWGKSQQGADFWFTAASFSASAAAPVSTTPQPSRGLPADPAAAPPTPASVDLSRLSPAERNKMLNDSYNAGVNAMKARNFAEAVSQFTTASAIDPSQAPVWKGLADAYERQGNPEKLDSQSLTMFTNAARAWAKAIAIKNDDPAFHDSYARILAYSKQPALAEQEAGKAALLEPSRTGAHWYNLGAAFVNSGQPAAAVSPFSKAAAAVPPYIDAYYQLGMAQNSLGRKAEAIDAFQRYLNLEPKGTFADSARNTLQTLGGNTGPR